jgi:uncharacterized protein (UPF0332 family)
MSFNYEDYLSIAQISVGKSSMKPPSEEALCRSAISRAYYAVFLTARDYLDQNTPLILPKDGTVHVFVREHFLAIGQTDGKFRRIGFDLNFLHGNRNKADYGSPLNNLPVLADNILQTAEATLKRLTEI